MPSSTCSPEPGVELTTFPSRSYHHKLPRLLSLSDRHPEAFSLLPPSDLFTTFGTVTFFAASPLLITTVTVEFFFTFFPFPGFWLLISPFRIHLEASSLSAFLIPRSFFLSSACASSNVIPRNIRYCYHLFCL